MNLIGKMLDNRYEILEKIGNGGMATVYKAKCHVLNRYVAIKILRDEFTTDSEFIKKFNSEAQSAASLTHPNIVSVFDVGNEDNLYYIVMELIQGKTLKEIIVEDGILPWKWSTNIAMQIASALETAHSNGIIHRDIKPHNIIITEDGVAKVTDFGIAKAVSNSTMTAFGTTIGSVHYFSPEHARGGFTDAKSDLYSLGVVMYEMLTGRVPFDADTPVSVALKQVQEEPVKPSQYNKDIPKSLERIILKAMQKDPNMRYQSADEVLIDLDKALQDPDGDFVDFNNTKLKDSPTQNIEVIKDSEAKKERTNRTAEKESKFKKFRNYLNEHIFLKILLILLILGILFIGVMCGTIAIFNATRPKQANIPNLVAIEGEEKNLSKDEAIKLLEEAGFKNYKIEEEYSDDIEEGLVIKQSPAYQKDFLYNISEEITLTISKGAKMVTLPTKIVGEKVDNITSQLDKLEVKYKVTEETSETVEKGIILECDQTEGSEISASTQINLKVSGGSQWLDLTMINVVGKTEEEAKKALEEAGFVVVTTENSKDTNQPDGVVLKQSEKSGTTVKENTTIILTINKLPKEATVTISVDVKTLFGNEPTTKTVTTTDEDGEDKEKEEKIKKDLVIKVGEDTIYSKKVTADDKVEEKWTTTGTKEVKIIFDGVTKLSKNIFLDQGDTTVSIP